MNYDTLAVGKRIQELRKEKGLTQEQLAERLNISTVHLAKIETGNYYSPTIIVIAVTRKTRKKPSQPTHVVLDDAEGLAPSLFMSEVIRTIDKRRVRGYVGRLTREPSLWARRSYSHGH